MLARVLFVLVLALSSFAAVAEDTKGPILGDLMKLPSYRAAWVSMLAGATVPPWVEEYTKTLDGPATPSIAVTVADNIYTLGFTCQPNNCGDNQALRAVLAEWRQGLGLAAHRQGKDMARVAGRVHSGDVLKRPRIKRRPGGGTVLLARSVSC